MSKKTRKRFTAQEKVAILRLHLLEHVPDLGSLRPARHPPHAVLPLAEGVLRERRGRLRAAAIPTAPATPRTGRSPLLEQKLQRKNEVLSELMEEHVQLKKELGEL